MTRAGLYQMLFMLGAGGFGLLFIGGTVHEIVTRKRAPAYNSNEYSEVVRLTGERNYDEALKRYQAILTVAPSDLKSLATVAAIYGTQGKVSEEIATYELLLKYQPESPEIHRAVGHMLIEEERLDEAIVHYTSAIGLSGADFQSLHERGIAYARRGDLDKALADFEAALKIKPDMAEAINDREKALALLRKYAESAARHDPPPLLRERP